MSTPPETAARVRVTSERATRGRSRRTSVLSEIDAQTRLGEVYMRSLMRSQLRLAVGTMMLLVLGVGLLPVVFTVAPVTRRVTVLSIPLPWLLLGAVVYPFLVLTGWIYVRRAERNERAFAELVEPSLAGAADYQGGMVNSPSRSARSEEP
ncbi:MAG TPA: hypothetical protein VFJ19_07695 [Nocardioidaceae bacterium]|nr:hypothetical protein [Nocardioidaceae bacterium]